MTVCPPQIIRWVAQNAIPQERRARAALRRAGVTEADIDDLLQEAYCRLAALRSVDHIDNPAGYFLRVVKNAWRDSLRRSKVVPLDSLTENAALFVRDETNGIEAAAIAKEELGRIDAVLATLPERCRAIFIAKRVEGLSQREIAARLGVSENVVENDIQKALRAIQRMLRTDEQRMQEEIIDEQRQNIG
jgi:RNA polymerase sigma-70 factor (ECF subfamily)